MRELNPHKVREMSAEEVRLKVRDLREEMFNLRFRNSMRQLDNPLKIREARRDLARLLTILKEHEMGVRTLGAGLAAKGGTAAATADAAAGTTAATRKKTVKKTAARKTVTRKPAAKKAVATRTAAKKPAAKKPAAAKPAARKTTRKAPAGAGK
jgi:large subunit ribosomal protein L29